MVGELGGIWSGFIEISQLTLELCFQMAVEEVRLVPPLLWMRGEVIVSPSPRVLQRCGDRRLKYLIAYNLLLKI